MELMDELVTWVRGATIEDLPSDVIDTAKKLTIDALGVAIAGRDALGIPDISRLVCEWGGAEEGTLLLRSKRVPLPNAALVNCSMARALDFGDAHEGGGGHLSETFVPVALLLAEYAKRPVSGSEFLLAMSLGAELSCRLRCASTVYPGWLAETFAPFGIVATASRILGFDHETAMHGMGIAYSTCSCNRQGALVGALNIRLQQGIAASSGVTAAILASRGLTGARDVLEGTYGFYPLYLKGQYRREAILEGIGREFLFTGTSLKPWPCCKHTHIPVALTMRIMQTRGIRPPDIAAIDIETNEEAFIGCASGDNKLRPRSIIDAQFSLPYTVASAAVRGKVGLDEFSDEAIADGDVLAMASRVSVRVSADIQRLGHKISPASVTLRTRGGDVYREHAEHVRGSPRDPMSWKECVDKFHACVAYSPAEVPDSSLRRLIGLIADLEHCDDVREIAHILS
jgi:2-methylcitrate dehydratase PrpD